MKLLRKKPAPCATEQSIPTEVRELESTKRDLAEAVQEANQANEHLQKLLEENGISIKIFVNGFGGKVRKKKVA